MFTDTIFLSTSGTKPETAYASTEAVTLEALAHYVIKCCEDIRQDPDYQTPKTRLRDALIVFAEAYNAAKEPEKDYNLPDSRCDAPPKGKVFCNGRLVDGDDDTDADQHFNW